MRTSSSGHGFSADETKIGTVGDVLTADGQTEAFVVDVGETPLASIPSRWPFPSPISTLLPARTTS